MKKGFSGTERSDRLSIGVSMLLIAGMAVGVWLAVPALKPQGTPIGAADSVSGWLFMFVFILAGMSVVGPPLLLLKAKGRPWGAGRLVWFVQGTATWLLWPPAIYHRVTAGNVSQVSTSSVCLFYGTPPMAVYVTLALLAGGHLKHSRRIRMYRSWQETFGLLLGLAWACTGLYIISLFYRDDFLRK